MITISILYPNGTKEPLAIADTVEVYKLLYKALEKMAANKGGILDSQEDTYFSTIAEIC